MAHPREFYNQPLPPASHPTPGYFLGFDPSPRFEEHLRRCIDPTNAFARHALMLRTRLAREDTRYAGPPEQDFNHRLKHTKEVLEATRAHIRQMSFTSDWNLKNVTTEIGPRPVASAYLIEVAVTVPQDIRTAMGNLALYNFQDEEHLKLGLRLPVSTVAPHDATAEAIVELAGFMNEERDERYPSQRGHYVNSVRLLRKG